MATNAFIGSGTTIAAGDTGSATSFVTIAEVKNIDGPSGNNPQVEVTHLGSTSQEFIAGLASQGTIACTANFDPTSTTHLGATKAILDEFDSKTVRYYRITWSDSGSATATFTAFVSDRTLTTPPSGAVELSFSLTISGAVTFAA